MHANAAFFIRSFRCWQRHLANRECTHGYAESPSWVPYRNRIVQSRWAACTYMPACLGGLLGNVTWCKSQIIFESINLHQLPVVAWSMVVFVVTFGGVMESTWCSWFLISELRILDSTSLKVKISGNQPNTSISSCDLNCCAEAANICQFPGVQIGKKQFIAWTLVMWGNLFIDTLRCTTVFVWFKIDRYCHHYWNQRWVHKSEVLACSLKMKEDAFLLPCGTWIFLLTSILGLFFFWCAQLHVRSGSSTLAKHTLKHTHAFQEEVIAALPWSWMGSYRVPGPGFCDGQVMPNKKGLPILLEGLLMKVDLRKFSVFWGVNFGSGKRLVMKIVRPSFGMVNP